MTNQKPINHNMSRRARCHNYNAPGTYMLTIVTESRRPVFGWLVEETLPRIDLSAYGQWVVDHELPKINRIYPMVHVWRYCIMPDHIHLIVNVSDRLPDKKHLGMVIDGFKYGCNKAYWNMVEDTGISIFKKGYNDKLLHDGEQLLRWKRYLDDNPRRLSIKRRKPDYFTVVHDADVNGRRCQIVGNRFLLDIPDKMAILVHRADTDDIFEVKRQQWLACGERGGVLVSAAISKREKMVMREAMDRGYNLIWVRENGFPPLYKPSGATFDACAAGQLLEVSPNDYHFDRRKISREQCLALNALAESIANG